MNVIHLVKETNIIQRMLALRKSREKRYQNREFIIEGVLAINEAFAEAWPIKALFYNTERRLSAWARGYIEDFKGETIYALSKQLMVTISDKHDCPELIVLAEARFLEFTSYQPQFQEVIVLVDQPKSPGNLGMIIRSAKALGASAVLIAGHAADEYDPKCIRSSAGTFFSTPIYRVASAKQFIKKIDELRRVYSVHLIATGHQGSIDIKDLRCDKKLIFLILGNETKGISKSYREIADQFVRINSSGKFTSLNVGAAAAIFLYEIARKRGLLKN